LKTRAWFITASCHRFVFPASIPFARRRLVSFSDNNPDLLFGSTSRRMAVAAGDAVAARGRRLWGPLQVRQGGREWQRTWSLRRLANALALVLRLCIVYYPCVPFMIARLQATLCSTIDVVDPAPGTYYITVTGRTATDEGSFGLRWDIWTSSQPPAYAAPSPLASFTPAATLSPEHHGLAVVQGPSSGATDPDGSVSGALTFAAVGAAMAAAAAAPAR
jgi:hypothetical protein